VLPHPGDAIKTFNTAMTTLTMSKIASPAADDVSSWANSKGIRFSIETRTPLAAATPSFPLLLEGSIPWIQEYSYGKAASPAIPIRGLRRDLSMDQLSSCSLT
jgi:hypothetical protein